MSPDGALAGSERGATAACPADYGHLARERGRRYLERVDRIVPAIAARRAETEAANQFQSGCS